VCQPFLTVTSPTVLHVLEALQGGGGTGRHLLDIVRYAPAVHHEVAVPRRRYGWPPDPATLAGLRDAGAVVHFVAMRRQPLHPGNAPALARLRRLVAERRPDVVHGHSAIGGVLGRLAAGDAARVYTPNGITTVRPALAVERALGRRTDRLVAVSKSEAELALRLALVDDDRIEMIPNGIEQEPPTGGPDLRRVLGLAPEVPLVGSVARLVRQKAPEDFVAVAAGVGRARPDVHFLLVGTGPLQTAVDRAVRRAGLGDRWHHMLMVPDVARVLGQLDVFALCSRFEGGPYTPLEAMRAGTAVVLTDVVGNRDAADGGRVGVLVPPGDVLAATTAVVELLDDPARRAELAVAGRAHVRTAHDVVQQGLAHADLYARLTTAATSR
jgi:glycosyltransferase involved in cell wall biosynthesis